MGFFEEFFDLSTSDSEVAVCCPFEHHTQTGIPYRETNPSAHVNTQDRVFHCKACGTGCNEVQFIEQILGCNFIGAKKLLRCFNNDETLFQWRQDTTLSEADLERICSFGISEEVAKELNARVSANGSIMFPVFMYNHLLDVRKYNPGEKPKVKSRAGCPAGLIVPFDLWNETNPKRVTLLCAGEKDMAVARSKGFNAITLTGGEQSLPLITTCFKDRTVCICYDNDEAGHSGARKVAAKLHEAGARVKIVTGFHEVCTENGQDITDFFVTYGKTKQDLINYLNAAPLYTPEEADVSNNCYPVVDLLTAASANYVGKLVRSNIQVVAVSESSFLTPTTIIAEKFKLSGQNNIMSEGETREWELSDRNIQDVLHLVDNNFKEATIASNIRDLLKIPQKEKYVAIKQYAKCPVYKAHVTDLFETSTTDAVPMEFTAYSLSTKLESGKKYMVTYKLVPHPYKGQQLTMLITNVVQASDSVSQFQITDETKADLKVFQDLEGTVPERVKTLTEKVKGILGYNGNDMLIQAMDLSYHTVLQFDFGSFKNVRGYLDTLIVGESRVGKSSTANALRTTYELGTFTSLAGNSATIPGLIGGSNKVNGAFQTRAGVIPQNHRGLIIFEEFGKSNSNIVKELTDIRSSNEVRITRVSGTITMPALVRMLTLTNVKSSDGQIKSIASYPNGITVITELVGTAEDIARYDLLVVLSDRGASQINPLWSPDEPLPKQVYQTRLRWIWSRNSEQVLLSPEVSQYIAEKANELNREYDSHIKIFGTEAWKKLARLAIAVAGYLVSTDDTYENIVVLKEHVDFAADFFVRLYDNSTFKLKEYVQHERQYSVLDDDGLALLQDLYMKAPTLLLQLEQCSTTNKNMLCAATGLTNDELNKLLNQLTRGLFIRFMTYEIVPTERFRVGMTRIERNTRALRLGEGNA